MAIVTGVIGFSFSNHVKASEAAQVTLLQSMTSLIAVSYTHLDVYKRQDRSLQSLHIGWDLPA